MKKFLVSVLGAAILFLGVGALADSVGARFKSDQKALDLIQKARQAMGGDAAIAAVESMTIVGKTSHNFNFDGQSRTEQGDMEIALQLPNKMTRNFRFGNGGEGEGKSFSFRVLDSSSADLAHGVAAGAGHVREAKKLFRVNADGTSGEIDAVEVEKLLSEHKISVTSPEGRARAFVVRKDGDAPTRDGEIMVLRKAEVEAAAGAAGTHRVIVRTPDGKFENADGTLVLDRDGRELRAALAETHARVPAAPVAFTGVRNNEMLRTTLALMLTAPAGTDVSYTFGGETVIDGAACNIVVATSGASSYKIYLSQSSNLPVAMSYDGNKAPRVMFRRDEAGLGAAAGSGVGMTTYKTAETPSEILVKYSDYRSVNGVMLPYKWTETAGGAVTEVVDVTNYEINPANIAEKFGSQRVFVRGK